MLQRALDHFCRVLSLLMVAALALMVVMVFGNVVLRYGFNSGIMVSEELSRWLFVWMTFVGALLAIRSHSHLGTDMLVARLPVAGRKVCLGVGQLLMLYMCWLMFRGAWRQTVINWDTQSPVMGASTGWFYASGLFFSVFAALFLLNDFIKLVTGRLAESELIAITESEDEPPHTVEPVALAGK